jgi:hypothetical protein
MLGRLSALSARLERNRRQLHARSVTDGLTQATTALAETMLSNDPRPEVWRLAAARASQLLALINLGAASLGQPLTPEMIRLIHELRAWSVTMVDARPVQEEVRLHAVLSRPARTA